MNFFDNIKAIYQKNRINIKADMQLNMTLNKWLSQDKDNADTIKRLIPYLFYIKPQHYFYLLYFSIPKKMRVPFLKKVAKDKIKENKLIDKIKYVLGWSNRELLYNMQNLQDCVLIDSKFWKKELGVK